MFGKASRTDYQTTLQIPARNQLLNEKTSHDGFASTRIVCQKKPQGLTRQHLIIDRGDLMRKGIDNRRVHRKYRVEQVGKADSHCLRHQTKQRAIPIEAPGTPLLHNLETRFGVTIEEFICHFARSRLVREFERVGAKPLNADHLNDGIGKNAANGCVGG